MDDCIKGTNFVEQKIKDIVAGKDVPAFTDRPAHKRIPLFVSKNYAGRDEYSDPIHVDINMVHNDILDIEAFREWRDDLKDAIFICEKDKDGNDIFVCGSEVEKMSKSKYNVQNLTTSLKSTVPTRFAFTKCSWDHSNSRSHGIRKASKAHSASCASSGVFITTNSTNSTCRTNQLPLPN